MLLFPAAFGKRAVPSTIYYKKKRRKEKKNPKQNQNKPTTNKLELSSQTDIKGSRDYCKPFHSFIFVICVIEVWLIHNVVLISAVQQGDLATHICTLFFIFFSIMVYHRL